MQDALQFMYLFMQTLCTCVIDVLINNFDSTLSILC